ncbi:MAG: DNA (cytosine-5-)-methyltransferase [Bacteroidetes bacterium]|nr:MAG: DNA (cytosine-5-)-methyltransferase [Bacteroidota bacterium]
MKMSSYSEIKSILKFDEDRNFTNEHAYITHYLQSNKNKKISGSYRNKAVNYIEDRVEEPHFQYMIPVKWDIPYPPPEKEEFVFIDLFSGIGGFRIALQNQNGKCVFSSEIDNSAKKTYESNFGEVPFGDIKEFTGPEINDVELDQLIPDHTILAGGFPCQPFSLAGVSARNSLGLVHGFDDKNQGNLFFDIMRIVSVKKPEVVFLENVKNFQRHDNGNTFLTVKNAIEKLGYSFHSKVINSQSVVPQKRQRFYMVCFKNPTVKFEFPEFSGEPKKLRSILEDRPSSVYTISDKLWEGHQRRTARNLERGTGFTAFTANLDKPSNTIVARYGKDGKECLIPQEGLNPRKLTPRECARLQGFPEEYILPSSNAAAYRQFGNSVAVPVINAIAQNIIIALKNHKIIA